ncbi:glutamate 5-kinase [bacterium Unc6]|nr:glutamate 5-kinase [bacterium Unc6]
MRKRYLHNIKRVVVKVGTSVLSQEGTGLSIDYIERFVQQIVDIKNNNKEVVLVSSGAIAAGMNTLGFSKRPVSLPELQACAAIGQGKMMKMYEDIFSSKNFHSAQVLITREDLRSRQRYLNSRNTLWTLLRYNIVPIVNENDTVAVDEIKFGDNDMLSSLVSILVEADLLIILSNVNGLYTKNPEQKDAQRINIIERIDEKIQDFAKGTKRATSVGGMTTKIKAAKVATSAGIPVIIANGSEKDILQRVVSAADVGTLFIPSPACEGSKKRWLLFSAHPVGSVIIDDGAKDVLLKKGKSLLPSGILSVAGRFDAGRVVKILDKNNSQIGIGIVSYSSDAIEKIKGARTDRIEQILGWTSGDEIIHRDNMGILRP